MRGVVFCSIGIDSYSVIPFDVCWGDIKKCLFLFTTASKDAKGTKDSVKVQLGKPMRFCRSLIEGWVTQRQLYHQEVP